MKIIHAISNIDSRSGGPAMGLAGLAAKQLQAGLDVRIISTFSSQDDTTLADRLVAQGVKVCLVGPVVGPLGRHPDLQHMLCEAIGDADVLHIHALWEEIQYQAVRTAMRMSKPYMISPHGMLDPWSLRQSKWKKKIYLALRLRKNLQHAAALHFTTQTEANLVAPMRLAPPAIIEANGVDLDEFEILPPPGTIRSRYPQIGDAPLIVFLGRIHYKKGFDLLIPAFAQLRQKNAILMIAGPDSEGYTPQIRKMTDAHGVTDRVIFTGMLYGEDRVAALADADLFCLPSYQENFGIAVAEALAAGTPVVISDQVNICSDVLAAGVGTVVPCKVEPLAAALNLWLEDKDLRQRASAAARPFVWNRYDWKQIAQRWIEHYKNAETNAER